MTRKLLPFVTLAVLFSFFALARPASSAAQAKKQVQLAQAKVGITSVALLATGCGVENNCVEVKWNVLPLPPNPQGMSFEVSGRLTTQNGSCNSSVIKISDSNARSAKVGFFQAGGCTGQVKSADMTVKLFTFDIEGQRQLTSTANKIQTF